ncbi:MAG: RagB/SusD family nutrient uptake outer membrane protein [Chitinophagaceae bacterium]|nr:RagB/SusD family nutrient uptake outer membrane protein [Chitinophagaceae bacterium]
MMKNNRYLLPLLILLISVSACEKDFLQEKPLDFLSPANAFSSVSGIEQGVIGIYSDVRKQWYRNGGAQAYGLFGLGTDVGYDGETPGGQRFLNNYLTSVTPDYSVIQSWWLYLFAEIQQANTLIDGIDKLDESLWVNAAQKNMYLAEARFFRAWAYRIAVTLWGDVPLITDVIQSAKTDFVRTPTAEIYKQIEDDLIFATQNLPGRGQEKAPGRLTKAAAFHLLTEVYLAQSKFQLAVNTSSEVIDRLGYALMTNRFGAQYDVFGTGDVYYDLFRYENQNAPDNTETIWAVQFEPNVAGGDSHPWSNIYSPRLSRLGNAPDGKPAYNPLYQDTLGVGVARSRGTNLVFYTVWEGNWDNDIRNAEHNIRRHFYYSNPQSVWDGRLIDLADYPPGARNLLKDTTNYIYPFVMKVWEPVTEVKKGTLPATGGGGQVHTDFYVMRLAETYLLRAEAYVGLGDNDLAAADINVVRNRANAHPVLPEDVDLDYILDERVRELYAEEMRMITLLRTGKLIERTRKYNDNPLMPGANIQDYNNLWPIPQQQLDLNRDNKWAQNPGYPQ